MKTALLNIERVSRNIPATREITVVPPSAAGPARLKVAAYARVSSDSEDQLNSYISQVRHYTALINENEEWEYADVYADEGLTGLAAAGRKDFLRMLADCRNGLIDRILVKSVSRFARNFAECLSFIHELKLLGVSVVFEKENIDTAKMSGELLLSMQANKAQKESLSISGNMRRGIGMRMKTGEFLPSSAPYGYRLNTKARTLEIVPEEAETVKRIYAEYLSGIGIDTISDGLNRDGIGKENTGARWHPTAVRYILANISYTGDMIWQKTYKTDEIPFKQMKNKGEKSRWLVRNNHPPIVGREDFEAAQKLMAGRLENRNEPRAEKHFLAKKVYCGECGGLCRRKATRDKIHWVCRRHDRGKELCPTSSRVPETEILSAFLRMREKLRIHSDEILSPMLERFRLAEDRRYRSDTKIGEVNRELDSLGERVLVLERLKAKGYMEPALYLSKTNELDRRIRAVRLTKRRLMEQAALGGAAEATERIMAALGDEAAEINGETFSAIAERVTLAPEGKVKFRLVNGLELTETAERGGIQ